MLTRLFLFAVISASAFGIYVVVAALVGWWFADGAVVYDMSLLPKRLMLEQFLDGYIKSLMVTIPLGLLAVLDYSLLARFRLTRILAGLSLPAALLLAGFWWYEAKTPAMITLAIVGLVLWLVYRCVLLLFSNKAR